MLRGVKSSRQQGAAGAIYVFTASNHVRLERRKVTSVGYQNASSCNGTERQDGTGQETHVRPKETKEGVPPVMAKNAQTPKQRNRCTGVSQRNRDGTEESDPSGYAHTYSNYHDQQTGFHPSIGGLAPSSAKATRPGEQQVRIAMPA